MTTGVCARRSDDSHGSGTHRGTDRELGLRFLGIGGSAEQGSPVAVLEAGGEPLLTIDCGPCTAQAFQRQYGRLPRAVYLTHAHLDHIGGLEELFHAAMPVAARDPKQRIRLFLPVNIIALVHDRVANSQFVRAEGNANFWDAFHLIPVTRGFWHASLWFRILEVRHMAPGFCYGLSLPGSFVFTGDTRPIPEVLRQYASEYETVFHDCAVRANPAHSGFVDLLDEYPGELLDRIVAYHYGSVEKGRRLEQHGFRIAKIGKRYGLPSRRCAPPELQKLAS